ncbi:MAG TPA: DUF2157 domain-containing protein [Candidatus Paceibacterota bacterium]
MNKEELLRELSGKINMGEVSREEVASVLSLAPNPSAGNITDTKNTPHFSITKMLYILGAAVVVIGIVIFVEQIWDDVGSGGRIAVTLGLGLLLTTVGSFLLKQKPGENIGSVFLAIGGALIPGGAVVTLSELNIDTNTLWPFTFTFGIIFIFYLLLNFAQKNAVLTFFAIGNGTTFIYLLVESMIDEAFYMHGDIYAYLTMIIGVSYLLLAYSFREGWNKQLVRVLYFFGTAAFLGAAFSRVFDSVPWQMLYFFIVIGGLFLAARLRSTSVLVLSTIFLIAHVSYITSEYFADSIGWPISLIFLGFIFIGLGYVSITINKKYIKT